MRYGLLAALAICLAIPAQLFAQSTPRTTLPQLTLAEETQSVCNVFEARRRDQIAIYGSTHRTRTENLLAQVRQASSPARFVAVNDHDRQDSAAPSATSATPEPTNASAQYVSPFLGLGLSFRGAMPELDAPFCEETAGPELFPACGWNLGMMAGYYAGIGRGVPRYDFVPLALRIGKITHHGHSDGPLRGNFEHVLEFSGAPATTGPGNGYIGASYFLRYNFVQPEHRLVPYVQLGAGMTGNDGFRDPNQRALGSELEFLLHAQLGARYFINDRLALNVEVGFIHISNAGIGERNRGINALGGSVGVTYFLGGPRLAHRCW